MHLVTQKLKSPDASDDSKTNQIHPATLKLKSPEASSNSVSKYLSNSQGKLEVESKVDSAK